MEIKGRDALSLLLILVAFTMLVLSDPVQRAKLLAGPNAKPPAIISQDDLRIGDITWDMEERWVRTYLGEPARVWEGESMSVPYRDYIYDKGVTVRLYQKEKEGRQVFTVGDVDVTNPAFPTLRGVRVGDPEEKVLLLYGNPAEVYFESYQYREGPAVLSFKIDRAGKVYEIQLYPKSPD